MTNYFTPLRSIAGYALGASTALLGKEASTVAVEESITAHYNHQLRDLLALYETLKDPRHKELLEIIMKFRDE